MSKRARNDGTETRYVFPPGDVDAFNRNEPLDIVEPGKYLSGDVPQAIHEQIATDPSWTLVDYTPPGSKQGKSTANQAEEK